LVQQLLAAKKDLRLDALLKKLDRFEAVILDDLDPDTKADAELPRTRGHAAMLANRAEALLLTRMQTEAKAAGVIDAMRKSGNL
jgi:hypothetical protein